MLDKMKQHLSISVPCGTTTGSTLLVEASDGRQIEITVPEGVGEGHAMLVEVGRQGDQPILQGLLVLKVKPCD